MIGRVALSIILNLLLVSICTSFSPSTSRIRSVVSSSLKSNQDDDDDEVSKNPLELAAWYGVEAFGKLFGDSKKSGSTNINNGSIDMTVPPNSLDETLQRLKLDSERSYFLSGEVDRLIYSENCVFADPFVSFKGRDRFIDNLANLGSFITNYNAKVLNYSVENDGTEVNTRFMVKLELGLPWKPVLAWPWGVQYIIDPDTYLVTEHIESWDIAPLEGVKQIFRKPTVKV